MDAPVRRPPGVPAVIPASFPEIPPSVIHPSKDLFTALDLQTLYAKYVKAPVNPGSYPRSFVSDPRVESRRGSNVAHGGDPASPGHKDIPYIITGKEGIRSPGGAVAQTQQQKGQANTGNLKKQPKPKLFSSVYEELLQELPDPVPLSPNESLLDIAYHRYPDHLDDPNFQFASLINSDKAKMALKLQIGHAQGVNGKYIDGLKSGVKSANQRRKERIRNKKNKDNEQRATAPAKLTSGLLSAASSPNYQTLKRAMTPTYGGSTNKTPGYGDGTPGYSSHTPGYSTKTMTHGGRTPAY